MPDEPHLVSKETFRVSTGSMITLRHVATLTACSGAHMDPLRAIICLSSISTCHSPVQERKAEEERLAPFASLALAIRRICTPVFHFGRALRPRRRRDPCKPELCPAACKRCFTPDCCYRIAMDHNLLYEGVLPASVQVPQATILFGVCKLDKILLGHDQRLHSSLLVHTSGASHLVSELSYVILACDICRSRG